MGEKGALPALRLAPLSARDARAAAELFHETVHAVNARDYTSEQLDAWAPGGAGPARRLAERLLAGALEREARDRGAHAVRTFASITARPFFERRGYVVLRENAVVRAGVQLTNFLMEKGLGTGR